jgi:hypothetical protein
VRAKAGLRGLVAMGLLAIAVAALSLAGCAGSVSNMREVATVSTVAAPGEAVVVFLRPSGMAFGVQSAVFEVAPAQPARLVGIVAAKKKVAYRAAPGVHTFMVLGESADFMEARLEPGRTYYALVTPRMGVWKARFSLRPVHALDRGELGGWQADTAWTELDEDSARWAAEHAADVEDKRARYMAEWLRKPEVDRPLLMPEDAQ